MIDPLLANVQDEIKEKVDFWRTRLEGQLGRFNTYADYWRLIKPARKGDLSGFSNPQVTETTRATEAIATFMYRAMTSAQPNFQFVSKNPYVTAESLWISEQLVVWQQVATRYKRKLLKALRSMALFGTVGIEEPWMSDKPYWESTDFLPRSLLQMAFDPLCFDIMSSPWYAVIDYLTDEQLRELSIKNPDVWDREAVESVISGASEKTLSSQLMARLSNAGYWPFSGSGSAASKLFEVISYCGPIKSDPSGRMYSVGLLNDTKVARGHESSYRRKPFLFAHMNEFELEQYAYGVGRLAESTQPELNSNRGRMHDTITFSLFNQWLANRSANIKTSQMKIRPWGVIEVDGDPETSLKALRPQLEGVNYGIQLENMMKTEFRSTSGASDNLQAMVTEATATEASIAQTEAVRRLSVLSEVASDSLLREHISKMHENNLTFLDQPFSIGVTGEPQPLRIFPNSLAPEVEVMTKIVTDKDFRPQRNKDLLQFLQVITSIRNQNPQMGQVDLKPFVEEFAMGIGMNPKTVWRIIPQIPGATVPGQMPPMPNAMDQVESGVQAAEGMRSNAGELGNAAQVSAAEEMAGAL